MYLQAHPGENVKASIDIVLGAASTDGRKWNIKVTQVILIQYSTVKVKTIKWLILYLNAAL